MNSLAPRTRTKGISSAAGEKKCRWTSYTYLYILELGSGKVGVPKVGGRRDFIAGAGWVRGIPVAWDYGGGVGT
jgi:hypothetical protein